MINPKDEKGSSFPLFLCAGTRVTGGIGKPIKPFGPFRFMTKVKPGRIGQMFLAKFNICPGKNIGQANDKQGGFCCQDARGGLDGFIHTPIPHADACTGVNRETRHIRHRSPAATGKIGQ